MAILETHWAELNEKLDKILSQCERTNGRVSQLERWRSWLTGGVAFTGLLITFMLTSHGARLMHTLCDDPPAKGAVQGE